MGLGMLNIVAMQAPLLLWQQMAHMALEAQMVIALRTAGMMGILRQDACEPSRMVTEKADACRESMSAAFRSAARGARADQILAAALKPYGRRTRANAKRLGRG